MEFSKAARELFIGDANMFYWAYIIVGVLAGFAIAGVLIECKKTRKRRKNTIKLFIEGLIRVCLMGVGLFIALSLYKIAPEDIIKTPVGTYYTSQYKEISKMNPIKVEDEISEEQLKILSSSGIYIPTTRVITEDPYFNIEKWSFRGKEKNYIYVIVEEGVTE